MISLGCAKNLVDGEYMVSHLKEAGYQTTTNAKEAEVIVVNTCGFIDSAKEESIQMILDMADYKKDGRCELLIATGCLSERYAIEMQTSLPELDAILGVRNYKDIVLALEEFYQIEKYGEDSEQEFLAKIYQSSNKQDVLAHLVGSHNPSTPYYAYLKIAEGCSNNCAFCAIPAIRGPFQSRPMEDILAEADQLSQDGFDEILLIAQDSGFYGRDKYKEKKLAELLENIAQSTSFKWIRVLYIYAIGLDDKIIDVFKKHNQIIPYFDIPIQHASNKILAAMGRRETQELIRERIEYIRQELPNAIIRTTVMVGYPGETEEDFHELLDFMKEIRFDRLGCFRFSPEEGTRAAALPNQVDEETKVRRYNELMELQRSISFALHESMLGEIIEVKIESVSEDGIYYLGRSAYQIPDVDPSILLLNTNDSDIELGNYYNCKIVEAAEYELTGVIE